MGGNYVREEMARPRTTVQSTMPSPNRNSGSAVSYGTSLRLSVTALVDDGRSNGNRPRACASPSKTSTTASSLAPNSTRKGGRGGGQLRDDCRAIQEEHDDRRHLLADP